MSVAKAASEYFETTTGNRVSRKSSLYGTQNIRIHGKSLIEEGVVIRGDLANVKMGKFCIIKRDCVLRPSMKIVQDKAVFFMLTLSDNVFIDEGTFDPTLSTRIEGENFNIGVCLDS
mmetsp:Transcript_7979/g.15817  ORF Transcript_7979/g.15817 Transcript_7979/m.15817 type:complete len:117 (+) Transcript_7979:66-416(+)